MKTTNKNPPNYKPLQKCPTGIKGFDDITLGGLPKGRTTLICGGAGSGKTFFGMEYIIRGAAIYKEPGLFMAFEEIKEELIQNMESLGFDAKQLIATNLVVIDHISIDKDEVQDTGTYNLDGLMIRLGHTINKFKIKRVVLDTLEALFCNFENDLLMRAELQRLFRWFKQKKVTVVVTSEQGVTSFSRYGFEEYSADCVVLLDNRMEEQISTRRLRVAKYRGSTHGMNEYPFTINSNGLSIIAITSIKLDYQTSEKHISSGVEQLDNMLGKKGYYRGSSVLISGSPGSGKTSFAAMFASATCQGGERCIYFALEEAYEQIVRNMKSINIDLDKWVQKDLLRFHAINPNSTGLEAHLSDIEQLTTEFKPSVIVIDPISHLKTLGHLNKIQGVLSLLIDFFKQRQITTLFTSLVTGEDSMDYIKNDAGISSLMDTWLFIQYILGDGERNRGISVLKSRGMAHSNQLREVILSDNGIKLQEVYIGQGRVLVGSARLIQASKLDIENSNRELEFQHKERKLNILTKTLEGKISSLNGILENVQQEVADMNNQREHVYEVIKASRNEISKMRMADVNEQKKEDANENKR